MKHLSDSFLFNIFRRSAAINITAFILTAISLLIFTTAVSAQADDPLAVAPPPIRSPAKDDVKKLDDETDIKDRTKLALDMLAQHLTQAETKAAAGDNDGMYADLGYFCGLMNYSLNFLLKYDNEGKQSLSNLKRFDLGLRAMLPRIEILRRNAPTTHEEFVRTLIKYVRDARDKALEPMFGDTVLSTKSN